MFISKEIMIFVFNTYFLVHFISNLIKIDIDLLLMYISIIQIHSIKLVTLVETLDY